MQTCPVQAEHTSLEASSSSQAVLLPRLVLARLAQAECCEWPVAPWHPHRTCCQWHLLIQGMYDKTQALPHAEL